MPIAIVGIGCRYADARGPEEFWEIVRSGRNTVRDAPQHRIDLGYDIDHFYDPRPRIPGKISSKKAGFLEHPELFDPAPFGIAPRDALTMEPQQRLLVEVTWDALEDAGIPAESVSGERVAVILGYMAEDYSRERTGVLGEEAVFRGHDVFTVGGMSHAVLSGRISFLLGVTGPSLTLDTACSSSLYATHLACESLRRGESKMAIAGGANLFLSPEGNIALSRSGMLSMSGACKAFDASADGFVRAEGAGVVVLRPLADAIADANPIYAVIRGSGISADGRDGGHMMAPGRKGQAQAMHDAYAQAGIDPAQVQYVETHGTGTMIGDPVEIAALADVMGPGRSPDRPLRVASVKGNLGHSESASGIAGLIKAALSIRKRELTAQLHFETPNPMIPWDEVPVRVQTETTPWPWPGPALVGVNSFGISGTNAHVILESPPERDSGASVAAGSRTARSADASGGSAARLIPISGHDANALHEMAELQARALAGPDAVSGGESSSFEDLGYTLARRRTHRSHRMAVVAASRAELRAELDAYLDGRASGAVQTAVASADAAAGLVMVFPGQGSQWQGMGRGLLAQEPVFAQSIDRLDAAFAAHVDWSLRAVLEGDAEIDWSQRLDVLQPVLIAIEIALAELWASHGIQPRRVIGQSMGEVAAAYVAGCLSLPDMARLACERGKVVAMASGSGAMGVVSSPREQVEQAIAEQGGRVEVAGSNSATTTIVSGDREDVIAVIAAFEEQGVFARQLDVDFASHCFHMDPLLETFRERIAGLVPRAARVPFDSTVEGEEMRGEDLDVDYWVRNLRQAVCFDRGLAASIEGGGRIFLEVSPHPALARPIGEVAEALGQRVESLPSLQRQQDESRSMLASLAALFVRGVDVAFDGLHPEGRVARTPLYAYQRKRFWFSDRNRSHRFRPVHPLLGLRSQSSIDPRIHTWDFVLDADSAGFMADYRLDGVPSAPVSIHPEIALAAAEAVWPGAPIVLRDLEIRRPLSLAGEGRRRVQVVLRVEAEQRAELRVASREDDASEWQLHAVGLLAPADSGGRSIAAPALDRSGYEALPSAAHFAALEASGVGLGARCRSLRELEAPPASLSSEQACADPFAEVRATERVARLKLPRSVEAEWHAYHAHPALMEEALQLVGSLLDVPGGVRVLGVAEMYLAGSLPSDVWCRVRRRRTIRVEAGRPERIEAILELFDREGQPIGRIDGLRVEARLGQRAAVEGASTGLHRIDWRVVDESALAGQREVDHWLIVSDSAAEASLFGAELNKLGASFRFCEKVEDLEPLVRQLRTESDDRWGFLLLAWARPSRETAEPLAHRAFRVGSWVGSIREQYADAAEVWIATRGLQPAPSGRTSEAITGRLVAQEIETFATCAEMQQCRLFDASDALLQQERVRLASLLGRGGAERQFVARGERLCVPRLVPLEAEGAQTANAARRLRSRPAGDRAFRALQTGLEGVAGLAFHEAPEPEVQPGSVVVETRSVALGQLDVLTALGLARPAARDVSDAVGMEFCGVVTAVADPNGELRVGDEVIGICEGALARRLVVPTTQVVRRPTGFDVHSAAALPFSFLVARHALEIVARLRAGERVLILSGAGGVGQALIQVAHAVGAEVTATARSAPGRAAIEALGAQAADGALAAAGEFDVIVGGDAGSEIHRLLGRLASGGRYLDLCPRGRFERPELGALRLAPNRSVSAIDVPEMMRTDPDLVSALLEQTMRDAELGRLTAIPTTVFPVAQASRALRFVAQNRHVGRVCLDLEDAAQTPIRSLAPDLPSLAGRGRFVVSGNEPEIQTAIADWLRDRDADEVAIAQTVRDAPAAASTTAGPAPCDAPDAPDSTEAGGWIHVGSDAVSGPLELVSPRADAAVYRALIFVRDGTAASATARRAWEARLWVDRLRLATEWDPARSLSLSVDRDRAVDEILPLLDRSLCGELIEPQLVVLDGDDLARRASDDSSPLLEEVEQQVAGQQRRLMLRGELLALALPERRLAMQRFVCDALAGVVGLSEEQRAALDLSAHLDSVGLDSLMTMELFMGIGRDLELEITAGWFGTDPTLGEIAGVLADRLTEEAAAEPAS